MNTEYYGTSLTKFDKSSSTSSSQTQIHDRRDCYHSSISSYTSHRVAEYQCFHLITKINVRTIYNVLAYKLYIKPNSLESSFTYIIVSSIVLYLPVIPPNIYHFEAEIIKSASLHYSLCKPHYFSCPRTPPIHGISWLRYLTLPYPTRLHLCLCFLSSYCRTSMAEP
jgi:hypothetical protein